MKIIQLGIWFAVIVSVGIAQEPMPRSVCKFDGTRATLRRVKVPAIPALDLKSDFYSFYIPSGTEVAVSGQKNGWSCVTANIRTPHAQEARSEWVESSRLESLNTKRRIAFHYHLGLLPAPERKQKQYKDYRERQDSCTEQGEQL